MIEVLEMTARDDYHPLADPPLTLQLLALRLSMEFRVAYALRWAKFPFWSASMIQPVLRGGN